MSYPNLPQPSQMFPPRNNVSTEIQLNEGFNYLAMQQQHGRIQQFGMQLQQPQQRQMPMPTQYPQEPGWNTQQLQYSVYTHQTHGSHQTHQSYHAYESQKTHQAHPGFMHLQVEHHQRHCEAHASGLMYAQHHQYQHHQYQATQAHMKRPVAQDTQWQVEPMAARPAQYTLQRDEYLATERPQIGWGDAPALPKLAAAFQAISNSLLDGMPSMHSLPQRGVTSPNTEHIQPAVPRVVEISDHTEDDLIPVSDMPVITSPASAGEDLWPVGAMDFGENLNTSSHIPNIGSNTQPPTPIGVPQAKKAAAIERSQPPKVAPRQLQAPLLLPQPREAPRELAEIHPLPRSHNAQVPIDEPAVLAVTDLQQNTGSPTSVGKGRKRRTESPLSEGAEKRAKRTPRQAQGSGTPPAAKRRTNKAKTGTPPEARTATKSVQSPLSAADAYRFAMANKVLELAIPGHGARKWMKEPEAFPRVGWASAIVIEDDEEEQEVREEPEETEEQEEQEEAPEGPVTVLEEPAQDVAPPASSPASTKGGRRGKLTEAEKKANRKERDRVRYLRNKSAKKSQESATFAGVAKATSHTAAKKHAKKNHSAIADRITRIEHSPSPTEQVPTNDEIAQYNTQEVDILAAYRAEVARQKAAEAQEDSSGDDSDIDEDQEPSPGAPTFQMQNHAPQQIEESSDEDDYDKEPAPVSPALSDRDILAAYRAEEARRKAADRAESSDEEDSEEDEEEPAPKAATAHSQKRTLEQSSDEHASEDYENEDENSSIEAQIRQALDDMAALEAAEAQNKVEEQMGQQVQEQVDETKVDNQGVVAEEGDENNDDDSDLDSLFGDHDD